MFTYQIRKRKLLLKEGQKLIFPAEVEIVLQLGPVRQFGCCGEGTTLIFGASYDIMPDLHRGRGSVISPSGLNPLNVFLEEPGGRIEMNGNQLHIHEHCHSALKLEERIQDLFFGIPILLNIEFFEPPIVEKVFGRVREVEFEWVIGTIPIPIDLTTQDDQEKKLRILGSIGNFFQSHRMKEYGQLYIIFILPVG